jgi:hypothetical protein
MYGIVPPYIHEQIARRGNLDQRAGARAALEADEWFRQRRALRRVRARPRRSERRIQKLISQRFPLAAVLATRRFR